MILKIELGASNCVWSACQQFVVDAPHTDGVGLTHTSQQADCNAIRPKPAADCQNKLSCVSHTVCFDQLFASLPRLLDHKPKVKNAFSCLIVLCLPPPFFKQHTHTHQASSYQNSSRMPEIFKLFVAQTFLCCRRLLANYWAGRRSTGWSRSLRTVLLSPTSIWSSISIGIDWLIYGSFFLGFSHLFSQWPLWH